jgi:hypothetical protein
MKYFLLFLLTIISFTAFAQSGTKGSVGGYVYDKQEKESIVGASVLLRSVQDSTVIAATASAENGEFSLSASAGKYILEVSFLGYYSYYNNIDITPQKLKISLDTIFLAENPKMLEDVVIEGKVPDIVVKGDTVEYNAGAYLMNEHALLKDLIENIPGAEIDENGAIKINGKAVNKVLVDGKEFFGSDIKTALENLPANMIKKLQLYNKESETSKITGLKDEEENPVLDLIVKEEFKMTFFGNGEVGYGTDDRYGGSLFANNMTKKVNTSIVGSIGNTGMGSGGYGGFSVGGSGESKHKEAGANVVYEPSDKLTIDGDVHYSDDSNETRTKEEYQTFLDKTGDRFGERNSFDRDNGHSLSTNLNIRWKIDSLTIMTFNTSNNFSNNKTSSFADERSYIVPDSITIGTSENYMNTDQFSTSNNLRVARNLGKEGRSVSMSLGYSYRKSDGDGTNNSVTQYPDITPDLIIDQKRKTTNDNHTVRFSVAYNEPLAKDKILSLSYNLQKNDSDRKNDTRKVDPLTGDYTMIDSAYARNTSNVYVNHNIRLRFQGGKYKDPWFYSASFGVNPTTTRNKISIVDELKEDIKQNTLDYSPEFLLRRNFTETSSFTVRYSGNTSQPRIAQLSADTVILSALSKQVGNPDLRTTFRNHVSLDYNKSDFESGRMFSVAGSFNYTSNDIVTDRTIDSNGNSISTYRNVDGQMSSNVYIMFNTPFRNKKFSISVNPNANFNKYIGYTNGEKSITKSYSFGGGIQFSFNDKKFKNYFRSNISHRKSDNNLTTQQNIENTVLSMTNRTSWELPYGFSLSNSMDFVYRWGFGPDYKKSELIWNPAVSKKIMKGNKGLIKVEAFDVLNERLNLSRYESSMGITQTWTNGIRRYVMFSFSYRFQTSGSGGSGDMGSAMPYF